MTPDQGSIRHGNLSRLFRTYIGNCLSKERVTVLEIGSYVGDSALHWSKLIAENCEEGGNVVCVDPWRPYHYQHDLNSADHYRYMHESLVTGEAFNTFVRNIATADQRAPISFIRGTISHAFRYIEGVTYDIVYIDGSHYYQDVKLDLAYARLLVRDGGFIIGDDLEKQLPEVDAQMCWANRNKDFVDGYHPGVTAAVWEEFDEVWNENGTWAVQRVGVAYRRPNVQP